MLYFFLLLVFLLFLYTSKADFMLILIKVKKSIHNLKIVKYIVDVTSFISMSCRISLIKGNMQFRKLTETTWSVSLLTHLVCFIIYSSGLFHYWLILNIYTYGQLPIAYGKRNDKWNEWGNTLSFHCVLFLFLDQTSRWTLKNQI